MSLGPGETIGFSAACSMCGFPVEAAQTRYRMMTGRGGSTFEMLARTTHPALVPRLAELQAFQARIAARQLTVEERAVVLREKLEALKYAMDAGAAGRISMLFIIGAGLIAIVVSLASAVPFLLSRRLEMFALAGLMTGPVVLGLAGLWWIRRTRAKGLAMLAKGMYGLDPSVTELKSAIADASRHGLEVARWLDADRLAKAIRASKAAPEAPRGP